jgi:hypothetical protein
VKEVMPRLDPEPIHAPSPSVASDAASTWTL